MMMKKLGLGLRLSKTQEVRFERAMERLESLSSKANSIVVVGDSIPVNHGVPFLTGHGDREVDGEILAEVCGVVEHTDNLVSVRKLRDRLVQAWAWGPCGRPCHRDWKVDINSNRYGVLKPASVNTNVDVVQKRKTSADELNMRNILVENDLVCAKVGKNRVTLQASGSKEYGKLGKGQFLKVDHYLVKRSENHFHPIKHLGIDLILSRNGFVCIREHAQVRDPMTADDEMIPLGKKQSHIPLETRKSITRTANGIRVLSKLGFTLTLEVIIETVNLSNTKNIEVSEMLGKEFHVLVAENEPERRTANRKKQKYTHQTV